MDKKLQNRLFRKYPMIFQDRKKPGSETRMCDGICCGDGWYDIIDSICRQLTWISNDRIIIKAFQIKEKFAALRFYTEIKYVNMFDSKAASTIDEIIRAVISCGYHKSTNTCDCCGGIRNGAQTISIGAGSWSYPLCEKCFKDMIASNKMKSKKKSRTK